MSSTLSDGVVQSLTDMFRERCCPSSLSTHSCLGEASQDFERLITLQMNFELTKEISRYHKSHKHDLSGKPYQNQAKVMVNSFKIKDKRHNDSRTWDPLDVFLWRMNGTVAAPSTFSNCTIHFNQGVLNRWVAVKYVLVKPESLLRW